MGQLQDLLEAVQMCAKLYDAEPSSGIYIERARYAIKISEKSLLPGRMLIIRLEGYVDRLTHTLE